MITIENIKAYVDASAKQMGYPEVGADACAFRLGMTDSLLGSCLQVMKPKQIEDAIGYVGRTESAR